MKRSEKQPPPLGETRLNQQAIGERLREMFDEVVKEPVPDEFLDLLRRADERRRDQSKDKPADSDVER
jgi:hypothetical protein